MRISEDLRIRNLIYDVSDEALLEKLDTETITFYLGVDPTGESLHVGHLATYLMAKRLVDAGHQPILVVGGGTGLIGDPSGKSKERNLLTLEETLRNADKLAAQVRTILPNAHVVNNYDWLKDISLIPFLRDYGKYFNLNHMLAKDSVKSRLDSGISFTEFTYQIIQSIDFLTLYERHGCTLQIGGQDQWGNITAGLDLIRKKHGHDTKAYAMVFPLVTKSDGSKFGKTAGGAVWLDPKLTSPYAFYQYWVNLPDEEALKHLWQFSFASHDAIQALHQAMQESPHLRHAQKALASEITQLVHGSAGLDQAIMITQALFDNRFDTLDGPALKMAFEGVKSTQITPNTPLLEALIQAELASSKTQARTLIKQNAISVNGEKGFNEDTPLTLEHCLSDRVIILKRGKKDYALLEITTP